MFVVTALLWVTWVTAEWAQMNPDIPTGAGHAVATSALRLLVSVASVTCVLAWLVGPILATARIWFTIGQNAERERCTCQPNPRRSVNGGTVIPLRHVRHDAHSES